MWTNLLLTLAFGDHNYGPVPPVELPDLLVTRHDGVAIPLRDAVGSGRAAVQFVFTDCQTACPLLGSLFRGVDRALATEPNVTLVSISVFPERDTPARLTAWRGRFHASARWVALRPRAGDLPKLLAVFGLKDPAPAAHSMQIYFVERARYVARSTELPRAAGIADALRGRSAMAGATPVVDAPQATKGWQENPASGEQLYYGTRALEARLGGELLAATSSRCANCHGAKRDGGAEGKTVAPALTRAALVGEVPRRGGPATRYTADTFCASLRTGVDPAGIVMSPVMPRYEISGPACHALWRFVSE